jgi:hypothetical protein
MENTLEQNERNALKILMLATDSYLKGQDELGKNFIAPQAQAAAEILNNLLNERWGAEGEAEVTEDAPKAKAKK